MNLKDNYQLDILDVLSIINFMVGMMNLEENLTQGDKQDLQHDLSSKADLLLKEIHGHLEKQDMLLQQILEELKNDGK